MIFKRLACAQKGLQDVLFSKIAKCQRDPAIMLVASVIEVSDFVWCLKEDKETQEKGKFFLIVVNLVKNFLYCAPRPLFGFIYCKAFYNLNCHKCIDDQLEMSASG